MNPHAICCWVTFGRYAKSEQRYVHFLLTRTSKCFPSQRKTFAICNHNVFSIQQVTRIVAIEARMLTGGHFISHLVISYGQLELEY